MLIVLTGKTASGKDTIKQQLLTKFPNLIKVITTTSRSLRLNEVKDIDYHFLTRGQFNSKIKAGEFAEYVEYGGNLYGTEKIELQKAFNSDTLWKIDPSRAGEVRQFIKKAFPEDEANNLIKKVLVFYINTDDQVILQRLKNRGLGQTEIENRMLDDQKIWQQYANSYDFVIENIPGKLNETVSKIIHIIENHSQSANENFK